MQGCDGSCRSGVGHTGWGGSCMVGWVIESCRGEVRWVGGVDHLGVEWVGWGG